MRSNPLIKSLKVKHPDINYDHERDHGSNSLHKTKSANSISQLFLKPILLFHPNSIEASEQILRFLESSDSMG